MSQQEPIYRKLYVGIRPLLKQLTTANAATVYMYLLTRLNDKDGRCDASAQTVAADLDLDVKTVRRAFKIIEAAGVAKRERRTGTSDNWSFPALDIRQTLPAERVYPQNGYTHQTDRGCTRQTGRDPTHETGTKEETIQEEHIEENYPQASPAGPDGASPVSAPENEAKPGKDTDSPNTSGSLTETPKAKPDATAACASLAAMKAICSTAVERSALMTAPASSQAERTGACTARRTTLGSSNPLRRGGRTTR